MYKITLYFIFFIKNCCDVGSSVPVIAFIAALSVSLTVIIVLITLLINIKRNKTMKSKSLEARATRISKSSDDSAAPPSTTNTCITTTETAGTSDDGISKVDCDKQSPNVYQSLDQISEEPKDCLYQAIDTSNSAAAETKSPVYENVKF